MVRKLALSMAMVLLSLSAMAQNNSGTTGATKGVPFQEVQQVINAANDALAAAVSANTSSIEANTAAIDAEEAARMAEDAALLARLAADIATEALARMEGDNSLADALAAEELARIADIDLLGTRIDNLGAGGSGNGAGTGTSRELVYTETDVYDIDGLREDIFTLDYQPGEWLYMGSTYRPSGLRSALCTAHPGAYNVLASYAVGGSMFASLVGSTTFVLREGAEAWLNTNATITSQPNYLRASATQMLTQMIDRSLANDSPAHEIVTYSSYEFGNTAVIRAGISREDACGF